MKTSENHKIKPSRISAPSPNPRKISVHKYYGIYSNSFIFIYTLFLHFFIYLFIFNLFISTYIYIQLFIYKFIHPLLFLLQS